jgi:hypothetical protein
LSHREWVRFDRPCWDHYCSASRWFASWAGGEVSTDWLLDRLRRWVHGNSFLGPLIVGTTAHLAHVEVVTAYRLVSVLGTVAALAVLRFGLLRRLSGDRAVVETAWWLAAAHPAVLRSFTFPQTDALAMLWVTAILALVLSEGFWRRLGRQAAALLLVASGLLVKLSLYPAVPFLPVAMAVHAWPRGRRDLIAWSARSLLWVAIPVGLFAAVSYGLGLEKMLVEELRARNVEADSTPAVVAEALVKAVFPFAPWIWLGFRRWGERERVLAAWAGLFVAALLAAQAAGYLRYHLVILPAYAGLAVPGLEMLRARSGHRALFAVAAGMTALAVFSLLANTYN